MTERKHLVVYQFIPLEGNPSMSNTYIYIPEGELTEEWIELVLKLKLATHISTTYSPFMEYEKDFALMIVNIIKLDG